MDNISPSKKWTQFFYTRNPKGTVGVTWKDKTTNANLLIITYSCPLSLQLKFNRLR